MGHQPHTLDFDAVLDESTSQRDVYETVAKPLVEFVLQGYNGCVLTYGTPGSGKSYSLQGGNLSGKQRGIISRAAEDLFNNYHTFKLLYENFSYHNKRYSSFAEDYIGYTAQKSAFCPTSSNM
ncbi:hypothetical protein scyTo_0013330 [Scyliorhinus torazame]|uniref:Kinesin motor domain-containing protein n=1 Tax=Scyliorhinus torazame TaxID=75743 RepID=A0A401NU06_SCYTO|nr:hypothetical protein [Scyliorhinus torazame]